MDDKNELKHVGVMGMRWGVRNQTRAGESHIRKAAKADKLIPKGGNLHRKAAEKHFKKAADLNKKIASVKKQKMSDLDKKQTKEELKKVAKTVAIGLGIFGAFHLADMAAGRYLQKYYANEIAQTLLNQMRVP